MSIAYAIQSLTKKLVTIVLAAMLFNAYMLQAMERTIITPDSLESDMIFEGLTKLATPLSINAHKALVGKVKDLTKDNIKELFDTLEGESTLKMALRLVYAKDHEEDLDGLKCDHFFKNIQNWVNGFGLQKILLFSQTYLQYVLPLIEPITSISVSSLNLYNNKLTSLPDSIGNLSNLKELNLPSNQLTSLPDSIGNLVNLEWLFLSDNQLTSLPNAIGNLVNLVSIDLNGNKLTSLPDSIGNLVNLKRLWLYNNKLTSLPHSIGNLVNLTLLLLSGNKLSPAIMLNSKNNMGIPIILEFKES